MEASSKPSFSNALCSAVILCGLLVAGLASAAQVYRWVDENGEVHYSESLPPDYHDKDQGHDVLNQQGMVVEEDRKLTPPPPAPPSKEEPQELPRDASGLPRPKAAYSETEMQQRMDSFLMLRYESEQEILDAMSVEIKQLNYDRRLLEASQASTDAAFRGHVKLAADRQRAGLAVEKSTAREIDKNRSELASIQAALDGLQKREDTIRADFEKQLERYRYLVKTWSDNSSGR
jgi:hypothetical protein